ncbi:MAG: RNA polymerase sigma factor [Solirubrobacterales bacterium]
MDFEAAMICEAQAGSEPAWRRLFELHFDAVYRFSLALAAGRRELAEETSQQTFVAAAQRIDGFDPRQGTFRLWLLGIARNRYMTLQASDRRRRRHESVPREPDCGAPGGYEPDLWVHETLARLPIEYRRALEDKYLHRRTMKEMAEADGGSIEAIESLLRRARDRFARIYEQMRNDT